MRYAESLIRTFGQRSIAKLLIPCLNETVCQQIAAELQATDGELADVFLNPHPWVELRLEQPPSNGERGVDYYGYSWGLHHLIDLLSDPTLITLEDAISAYIQRHYWRFAAGWLYVARRKRRYRSENSSCS